jgi:PPOX class probable F420-dependent enzyme
MAPVSETSDDTALHPRVVELAQAQVFAAVTTLLPDGTPMTKPLWITTDGEHLVINTEIHRQGYRNIQRDPRVTVTLVDPANSYSYAEVRGQVVETVTGPEARAGIDELSRKYTGRDYGPAVQTERVMLKIAPKRQFLRL